MKPTLVVVGFSGELKLLELQARSVCKYASDAFEEIVYVINEKDADTFKAFFDDKIAVALGSVARIARILRGRDVAEAPLTRADWRSQQSLKLLSARFAKSSHILILDSKNHFVRPVSSSSFVSAAGKMLVHRYPLNPRFLAQFENACSYFGADRPPEDYLALPTVAPFMMSKETATDLVKFVEGRENKSFHEYFCGNKQFTEFYFYLAFVLSQPGQLENLYEDSPRKHVTVFRSMANEPDIVGQQVSLLEDSAIKVFGVHRHVLELANPSIIHTITAVWKQFGLVRDEQEAAYFLTPDTIKRKRWYWPF